MIKQPELASDTPSNVTPAPPRHLDAETGGKPGTFTSLTDFHRASREGGRNVIR